MRVTISVALAKLLFVQSGTKVRALQKLSVLQIVSCHRDNGCIVVKNAKYKKCGPGIIVSMFLRNN